MSKRPLWISLVTASLAIGGGLLVGAIDLHANEMIVTFGFILGLNMVLGAIESRRAWLWAALSILGVPFLNWFPRLIRVEANPNLDRTLGSFGLLTLVMFVAAMIGEIFGAIFRRSVYLARAANTTGAGPDG